MSLPLLVNGGAECGPSNPLQGLSKQLDQDRGIQRDFFGSGRAGSSRETFRTQYAAAPGVERDAAQFFAKAQIPSVAPRPSAYDLSTLHQSLPEQPPMLSHATLSPQSHASPWAADFMSHQSVVSGSSKLTEAARLHELQAQQSVTLSPGSSFNTQATMPWSPLSGGMITPFNRTMYKQTGTLQSASQVRPLEVEASSWEVAFQSQEAALSPEAMMMDGQPIQASEFTQEQPSRHIEDADELARTAGVLLETVQNESNPKFKNSQFLSLMRQVRDREVVIEGSDLVEKGPESAPTSSSWAADFQSSVDVKGKGKATDVPRSSMFHNAPNLLSNMSRGDFPVTEDAVDAYLRQENEDYIQYWNNAQSASTRGPQSTGSQMAEWDQLQQDWDAFEATATGLRPVFGYHFEPNNPYLLGDSSRTRHHGMHYEGRSSLYESLLEMEAAVQRNRHDAQAWYELGVKQQENEREQKAIQALQRALQLDPTHLSSWLALAVSHTNEGNRQQTYNAIRQWVDRNDKYRQAVMDFNATNPEREDLSQAESFERLAQCLMSMARSDMSGNIDADIQIALAVLLNANEEYDKSRDCFLTALAVRPDDWLLYNRVGATLANSGHPDEALQYYYRALDLNPGYIRARFNLGISCINLRRYEEASQVILDALVLQDSDSAVGAHGSKEDNRGVTSASLWDSLKTCCLHMQRIDLATICDKRDLEAFRLNFQLA